MEVSPQDVAFRIMCEQVIEIAKTAKKHIRSMDKAIKANEPLIGYWIIGGAIMKMRLEHAVELYDWNLKGAEERRSRKKVKA